MPPEILRVGIDGACWHNTRGYGRHARSLLTALVRRDAGSRYTFITDVPPGPEPFPDGADVRLVGTSAPATVAAAAGGRRAARDLWRMSRALSAAPVDVLLFPSVYSYVPVWSRARKIVFIHDIIVETFPELTLPRRAARLLWHAKVGLARAQADAVVTVSEHSRQGIVERFRLSRDRVFVVGEASDPVFRVLEAPEPTRRLAALGLAGAGRTLVYVGGFGPHKNLGRLVEVFGRLARRAEFADVRLVMVGDHEREAFHSEFAALSALVKAGDLADRVVFTGFLPDAELVVLLNRATALVLPSLLEGFGLPAVEAAACGCPVVATTRSPLPDLLGAGGLYVDPRRADQLEEALARVLGSAERRRAMRAAGLAAARKLTWDAAARQLIDVMRAVTGTETAGAGDRGRTLAAVSGKGERA